MDVAGRLGLLVSFGPVHTKSFDPGVDCGKGDGVVVVFVCSMELKGREYCFLFVELPFVLVGGVESSSDSFFSWVGKEAVMGTPGVGGSWVEVVDPPSCDSFDSGCPLTDPDLSSPGVGGLLVDVADSPA
jgi:hypothetical protein